MTRKSFRKIRMNDSHGVAPVRAGVEPLFQRERND
jgi:hypothetical protein